jgi:hypothetical protein
MCGSVGAPTSFPPMTMVRTSSGGRISPVRLPPSGGVETCFVPGGTILLEATKIRKKTPTKRQLAYTRRRQAGESACKRTTRDRSEFSTGMPPDTSRLERGGHDFLQGSPEKEAGGKGQCREAENAEASQRGEDQAPIDERRAFARDWLKRWTSASCSASTMTRASCSVPE